MPNYIQPGQVQRHVMVFLGEKTGGRTAPAARSGNVVLGGLEALYTA